MAKRSGSADLPLHGGRVPAWLGQRMSKLGGVITEAIVHHYGRDAFLERLAHPFWFQALGAVLPARAALLPRSIAPPYRTASISICTASS
jgi:hypothetical protein